MHLHFMGPLIIVLGKIGKTKAQKRHCVRDNLQLTNQNGVKYDLCQQYFHHESRLKEHVILFVLRQPRICSSSANLEIIYSVTIILWKRSIFSVIKTISFHMFYGNRCRRMVSINILE